MQLIDYAFNINKIRWKIRIFSCSRHIPVPDLNLWAKALLPIHLQCAWVSQSCQPFAISWTIAGLAPLSMEFTTGMGSYSLLQGIFLTEGSNPDPLHCRQILTIWVTWEDSLAVPGWDLSVFPSVIFQISLLNNDWLWSRLWFFPWSCMGVRVGP